MRGLSIKKILIMGLLVSLTCSLSGCEVFDADKNKNSYLTTPYDVIPVDGEGSTE